jgi:NitT/TauT family transport system substrate-binding protein
VRAGEGIASPRDLAGRRIGVSRGTSADFFLERSLARSGIRPQDVVLVDLAPGALAAALASGHVDAVAAFAPYSGEVRRTLGPRTGSVPVPRSRSAFALVATPSFAEGRRHVAEALLRALLRAGDRARRDREGAARVVAREIGMDPAELAPVWENLTLDVELEQSLLLLLEEETRWAIRSGLAPRRDVPDLRTVLAPAPLQSVRPRAVRLTW